MIDDSDLTGDAFENDNKDHLNKEYGKAVKERNEVLESGNFGSIPDPECKSLIFTKPDGVYSEKNTPLAASSEFLCYILKGNMIRVTKTDNPQEKLLIKGHENEISDIKFSDSGKYLCSVSSDKINIWKLVEGPSPDHINMLELPFGGSSIEPHPYNDGTFAISSTYSGSTYVALISVEGAQVHSVAKKFEELSGCEQVRNVVIDMAFAPDGHSLYIGMPTSMTRFNVGVSSLTKTADTIPFQEENPNEYTFFGVKTFTTLYGLAVITCHSNDSKEQSHEISINVCIDNAKVQTLSLSLPLTSSVESSQYSMARRKNGIRMHVEPHTKKYFVITSACSNQAVCLAVRGTDSPTGYPIYHATPLNIRFAMSGSAALVCMKDGKEHLVISCQQEMSSAKGAIQQYSIPVQWVFQPPNASTVSFGAGKSNSTPSSNGTNSSGSGLLSMLGLGNGKSSNGKQSSSSSSSAATAAADKIEGDVTGTSSALMNMVIGGSKQAATTTPANSLMSFLNSGTTPVTSPATATVAAISAPNSSQPRGITRNDLSMDTMMTLKAHEASLQETGALKSSPIVALSEDEDKKASGKKEKKPKENQKEKEKLEEKEKDNMVADMANDDEKDPIRAYFKVALRDQAKALVKQFREDLTKHETKIKVVLGNATVNGGGGNGGGVDANKISKDIQETVKAQMTKQFRANFENILLPAFQAGTQEMFSQMNAAFQEGIAKMVSQTQALQSQQNKEIAVLRAEVQSLRGLLTQQVAGDGSVTKDTKHEITDPMELVNIMKYFEAVQLACERKDINVLEQVLEKMHPTEFLEGCESKSGDDGTLGVDAVLLIMCVMQQISAGLKSGESPWGLEKSMPWLSNLIPKLSKNEGTIYEICGGKTVVKNVLSGISADLTEVMVANKLDGSSHLSTLVIILSG